jgi:hypothetical protein
MAFNSPSPTLPTVHARSPPPQPISKIPQPKFHHTEFHHTVGSEIGFRPQKSEPLSIALPDAAKRPQFRQGVLRSAFM